MKIIIHNAETNQINEREMNAEELAQWESDQTAQADLATAQAQKAADKAALLAKLGITQDEAKLLLS
jgi:hypothetical protein